MLTPFTLCADDFGDCAPVSEAILALGAARRLNAASVMVTRPETANAAAALVGLPAIAIGLHVTLSDGEATRPSALAPSGRLPHIDQLTARAFAGRLPLAAITAEIEAQLDRFETLFGRAPDFIDAHQHSHVLPGIRTLFLGIAARRAPHAWVRTCEERLGTILHRGIAPWRAWRSALLSRGLTAAAAGAGLATNAGFAGLYDLRGDVDYWRLFPRWLRRPGPRHLIICHPSRSGRAPAATPGRVAEHCYLANAPLDALFAAHGLCLFPSVPAMAA